MPPGKAPLGTCTAKPVRKISSSPETGAVVIHVLGTVSKVVEVHVALGEKVICAFGTDKLYCVPFFVAEMVELVKVMVPPALGIPLAVPRRNITFRNTTFRSRTNLRNVSTKIAITQHPWRFRPN